MPDKKTRGSNEQRVLQRCEREGRRKRIERKAIVEDKGEGYVETETLYL